MHCIALPDNFQSPVFVCSFTAMFWTLVTSTWCLFAFASRSSASFNSTTIIDGLKASGVSLSTQIVLISDPTYKTFAQQRWSTYDGPTYLVSVKPALESDVVQIVGATVIPDFSSRHSLMNFSRGRSNTAPGTGSPSSPPAEVMDFRPRWGSCKEAWRSIWGCSKT